MQRSRGSRWEEGSISGCPRWYCKISAYRDSSPLMQTGLSEVVLGKRGRSIIADLRSCEHPPQRYPWPTNLHLPRALCRIPYLLCTVSSGSSAHATLYNAHYTPACSVRIFENQRHVGTGTWPTAHTSTVNSKESRRLTAYPTARILCMLRQPQAVRDSVKVCTSLDCSGWSVTRACHIDKVIE